MKLRLIHTLFLLCIYLGINAQQNICNHTYHIGDKIERQQATFKHFDQKGKGAIWDLTDINLSDNVSWLTITSNPHDEHGLIINGLNTVIFVIKTTLAHIWMAMRTTNRKLATN